MRSWVKKNVNTILWCITKLEEDKCDDYLLEMKRKEDVARKNA